MCYVPGLGLASKCLEKSFFCQGSPPVGIGQKRAAGRVSERDGIFSQSALAGGGAADIIHGDPAGLSSTARPAVPLKP